MAIAADSATFALSEVRLGLIPATIGPYVADAIGWRQARRYFLSAERIDAALARQLGLVHDISPAEQLDARIGKLVQELCKGAPAAQAEAKLLLADLRAGSPLDDALLEKTAWHIARVRSQPEAREGLSAFLDKRPPGWLPAKKP